MINFARPSLGAEEKEAVCRVIDSGMIASGTVVEDFNRQFADYIGVKFGIATTNGTTALEVALRALGIGPGDKVLTTPFSFIASTNSILYAGAVPVFADIDPKTFNIAPDKIEEKLKKNPGIKALLIVHLFGQACDMDSIMPLVKKYNLLLIEDCAQAHGAKFGDKKLGTFGDAAAFSFYPTKNMTTGEGGMVLTNNENTAERSTLLINHGMKVRYYHDIIGYNHRMTNVAAAIGLCQLKKLDAFNNSRNKNAEYYNKNIKNQYVQVPYKQENAYHCYHQYTILVSDDRRDDFIKYLSANEVGSSVFYPLSIPEQKCYEGMDIERAFPAADKTKKEVVSLPVHPLLTQAELSTIVEVINAYK